MNKILATALLAMQIVSFSDSASHLWKNKTNTSIQIKDAFSQIKDTFSHTKDTHTTTSFILPHQSHQRDCNQYATLPNTNDSLTSTNDSLIDVNQNQFDTANFINEELCKFFGQDIQSVLEEPTVINSNLLIESRYPGIWLKKDSLYIIIYNTGNDAFKPSIWYLNSLNELQIYSWELSLTTEEKIKNAYVSYYKE